MSAAFGSYVRGLFGSEELADCTVVFCLQQQPVGKKRKTRAAKPSAQSSPTEGVGEPLPAHRVVLCGGSERLRAQAQRWTAEEQAAGGRPELRVPLASADELPAARAAVRFIYTGELSGEGCTTCAELLAVRVQADYLQVDGGVAACDRALVARVSGGGGGASDASAAAGAGSNSTPSLAGVLELYACRHQLPEHDAVGAAATAKLLLACREALVKYCTLPPPPPPPPPPQQQQQQQRARRLQQAGQGHAQQQQQQAGAAAAVVGGVGLGELLAFAFRDAPSALSDPQTTKQLAALPAAALEALLACDAFGTDNEASVLLLLAEWRYANRDAFAAAADRLCRQVRLRHLNAAYLYGVLPCLSWFPLTRQEHYFLCQYVAATDDWRKRLAEEAKDEYDIAGPRYAVPARPQRRSDAGQPYAWRIEEGELAKALEDDENEGEDVAAMGSFSHGDCLVSQGFYWTPTTWLDRNAETWVAGVRCDLPGRLEADHTSRSTVLVSTSTRFVLHTWRPDGSRGELVVWTICADQPGLAFVLGAARGDNVLLPAEQQASEGEGKAAGAARAQLQRWRECLHDGAVHGTLTWL